MKSCRNPAAYPATTPNRPETQYHLVEMASGLNLCLRESHRHCPHPTLLELARNEEKFHPRDSSAGMEELRGGLWRALMVLRESGGSCPPTL